MTTVKEEFVDWLAQYYDGCRFVLDEKDKGTLFDCYQDAWVASHNLSQLEVSKLQKKLSDATSKLSQVEKIIRIIHQEIPRSIGKFDVKLLYEDISECVAILNSSEQNTE